MVKIYLLVVSDFNGCDVFENILDAYAKEEDAEMAQLAKEDENDDPSISFYVRPMDLLGSE